MFVPSAVLYGIRAQSHHSIWLVAHLEHLGQRLAAFEAPLKEFLSAVAISVLRKQLRLLVHLEGLHVLWCRANLRLSAIEDVSANDVLFGSRYALMHKAVVEDE